MVTAKEYKGYIIINDLYAIKIEENKKSKKSWYLQDKKILVSDKEFFINLVNEKDNILLEQLERKYIKSEIIPMTYNIKTKSINGYIRYNPFKNNYSVCTGKPSDRTCLSWEYDNIKSAVDCLVDYSNQKLF